VLDNVSHKQIILGHITQNDDGTRKIFSITIEIAKLYLRVIE
jgi:hypothetical protein